jgi:stearoyl-CoA desaturase (Delta-9 desaturase)
VTTRTFRHGGSGPTLLASGVHPRDNRQDTLLSSAVTLAVTPPRRFIDKVSTVLTVAMHLACVGVFFVPVSKGVIALAVVSYLVRMFAITAGYHRYFSHRSYKTSRAFQLVLAVLGTMSMQNGPLWWASWHRRHHKHSDTVRDAHSVRQGGFYHAHIGWFLEGGGENPDLSNVRDLTKYPELVWLETYKWVPLVAYGAICFAIGGVSGLFWGFFLSTIVLLHATMLINSLAHVWGSRRFETTDDSKNNALLALLTLGEGWHNNHHHLMSSTRQGVAWWELDIAWLGLRLLGMCGLVWDLRTHASIARKRQCSEGREVREARAVASASASPARCSRDEEASTSAEIPASSIS